MGQWKGDKPTAQEDCWLNNSETIEKGQHVIFVVVSQQELRLGCK